MDATGLQVLREPGRVPTRKSYAYCFRGGAIAKAVKTDDASHHAMRVALFC